MAISDRPLNDVEFVAFDLETTGLFPISCRIVEFGAVRFRLASGELDRFNQLADPGCPIPADATRVHGITDAMVRDMPCVAEVLPQFMAFLGGRDVILLAHNARFDLGFLSLALAKLGIRLPDTPVLDTLALSRRFLPGLGNYRLETVARHLRLAESEDHRALSDARLAMGAFRAIASRIDGLATRRELLDIGRPLHFTDAGNAALPPPPGFEDLEEAIVEARTVVFTYDGGTSGPGRRQVTPRGLLESRGRAYLIALCHASGIEKTYRLDRIRELWLES